MTLRRATAADAPAIAAVHVACWRETYAGILDDDFLARLDAGERARRWRSILGGPHDLGTYVASLDGETVGFASGCPQRHGDLLAAGFRAEIATIYVLRRAQRHGLGRALMAALALGCADRGIESAALWVFEANAPARRFYEALGGEQCGAQITDIAGQQLPEVAYGWCELSVLR